MGFLDAIFKRNSELEYMFDADLLQDTSNRIYMKKLAIHTCVSFIARTISQSEFQVRDKGAHKKDELYYRLNVRPNKNQTASTFWEDIINKLIHDNEALIIKTDDDDLLVADTFTHNEYAVFEDTFTDVTVKEYTFKRVFKQSEVLHLKYRNERLAPLIDGLYADYGDLFGRILNSQKRKNQIRSTVKVDALTAKSEKEMGKLQGFINKMYKAIGEREVAIIPEQPGFDYKEHFSGSGNGIQSVEELNKVTGGFFDQVALALNIPLALIKGEMADVEKVTKNYMLYTINPLLKKIKDEINSKFFSKEEYLTNSKIMIKAISYQSIFDLATAVDKLRASGLMNGHEIRDELGLERADDPLLDKYFITKNYQETSEALGGGENNEAI